MSPPEAAITHTHPTTSPAAKTSSSVAGAESSDSRIKTRQGSGYLKQLYSTARQTAGGTHSHLKNLTTFLVNFIPVDKVDASSLQVRVYFDPSEIQALAASIKAHGVLQPILVVQNGDRYKVIAGERRLRATQLAGLDRIPARVLATHDQATHEIALRENLDRVDLHPLEEGEGYLSLLETQAYKSHEAIAQAFGKAKSRITECIALTRLPAASKALLLEKGVKNRALLRDLLNRAEGEHAALIERAAGLIEILSPETANLVPVSSPESASSSAPDSPRSLTPKKIVKPFRYRTSLSGVRVSSFRWKTTDSLETLKHFQASLHQLLAELESLTRSK